MEKKRVKFKVFRFNSGSDYLPYFQEFTIEVDKDHVVLDILNIIKWEFDSTFTYRRSCRHGICGSCAVKINNKGVLSCKERVFDLIDTFGTEMTIYPQDENRVIKDMVIDKSDFWKKYDDVKPYLQAEIDESPECENIVSKEEYERLDESDVCVQCGACYYSCTSNSVNKSFLGPAALAKAYRFVADIRDNATKERLEALNELESGIWDCVKCFECGEVCPKGVNPIDKITKLHTLTFKEEVAQSSVATRHAVGFKSSIKKHGLLDEGMLVAYSEGAGVVKHMGDALKMFKKGKVVLPWNMPKSEKLDEIKKLIEISSEAKF